MTNWGTIPRFPWRDDAHIRAEFPADDKPLAQGESVAWVETTVGGVTTGVSSLHRALNDEVTLCGARIPGAIRRLLVTKSLRRCGRCEAAHLERQFGMGA